MDSFPSFLKSDKMETHEYPIDPCLIDSLKESPSPLDMTSVSFTSCTTNSGFSEGDTRPTPYPIALYSCSGRERITGEPCQQPKPSSPILGTPTIFASYSEPNGTGFHSKSEIGSGYSEISSSDCEYFKPSSYKITSKDLTNSPRPYTPFSRPRCSNSTRHLGCGGYVTSYSPPLCDKSSTSTNIIAGSLNLLESGNSILSTCNAVLEGNNDYAPHNSNIKEETHSDTSGILNHETSVPMNLNINSNTSECETNRKSTQRRLSNSMDENLSAKKHNSSSATENSQNVRSDLERMRLTESNVNDSCCSVIKVTNPFNFPSKQGKLASSLSKVVANVTSGSSVGVKHELARPPFSYVAMIRKAILESPAKKATLREIYNYILETFPYYESKDGWKNSIRHNLSLNKCFVRKPRDESGEKKGGFWTYNPAFDYMFENNNFRRRKRMRRTPGKESAHTQSSGASLPPAFTPPFSRPYPPTYLSPNDFLPSDYRAVASTDRSWPLAHMQSPSQLRQSARSGLASYPSCQRMQPQTLHVGYMQSTQMDPTTSQSSIPLPANYPTHGYVAPSAAFPGHYPAHCLRESTPTQSRYPY